MAEEIGVYPNINNLEAIDGQLTFFGFNGSTWGKAAVSFPQGNPNGVVEKDNINAVSGGTVYEALEKRFTGFTLENEQILGHLTSNNASYNRTDQVFYVFKFGKTSDYYIDKIQFPSIAGKMNFSYGLIDQNNKFIESETFIINAVTGINTVNIQRRFKANQFLAIKTPGIIPAFKAPRENGYLFAATPYTNPIEQSATFSFALTAEISDYIEGGPGIATKADIDLVNNRIDNIIVSDTRILTAPNGIKYRLKVDNLGNLLTEKLGNYSKVLHLGNSILKHAIVSYWWGNWGMAASTRDKDYAHQFLSKLKISNPSAQSWEENIATWEINPSGFNKSSLDPLLTAQQYDLIVIRLGENVTYSSSFKLEFKSLINYIQLKVPAARIVIGGLFWAHAQKEIAMQEVANELSLTFISLAGLDTTENRSKIGAVVQGDDGQSHTVNNQGVADHPGDAGMLAIAEKLFSGINS